MQTKPPNIETFQFKWNSITQKAQDDNSYYPVDNTVLIWTKVIN